MRHQKLPESRNSDYVTRPSSKISARFTLPTVPQVNSFSKKYVCVYVCIYISTKQFGHYTISRTYIIPSSGYTHIEKSRFERWIFFTVWSLIYINQDWSYKFREKYGCQKYTVVMYLDEQSRVEWFILFPGQALRCTCTQRTTNTRARIRTHRWFRGILLLLRRTTTNNQSLTSKNAPRTYVSRL